MQTTLPYLELNSRLHDCADLLGVMCHWLCLSLALSLTLISRFTLQNINHFDLFGDMSTPPSVRSKHTPPRTLPI